MRKGDVVVASTAVIESIANVKSVNPMATTMAVIRVRHNAPLASRTKYAYSSRQSSRAPSCGSISMRAIHFLTPPSWRR